MNRHKQNDFKMTGEMLEDMRMDDEETDRLVAELELNIKKRFELGGKNVDSFEATRMAIWDTFKG